MIALTRFLLGPRGTIRRPFFLAVCHRLLQLGSFIAIFLLFSAMWTLDSEGAFSSGILLPCLALAIIFPLYFIVFRSFARLSMNRGYAIVSRLRVAVCDRLRTLSLAFFRKLTPARISAILLHDMEMAEAAFCLYLYEVLACVLVPVLIGMVLLFFDWQLATAMFVFTLPAVPVIVCAYRAAGHEGARYMAAQGRLDMALLEYLGGIGELKSAGRTGARFLPYTEANTAYQALSLHLEQRFGLLGQLFLGLLDLSYVLLLALGGFFVLKGSISLPVFVLFLLAGCQFLEPLRNLGVSLVHFRFAAEALKRIAAVLNESPLPRREGFVAPENNSLRFSDLYFAYPGAGKDVLHGVSFTVAEGTVTALVGESGGGKSTIANLLLRFWDVKSGSITIGGTDIRAFSQEELYAKFSVVFQEVYLFNDSVMNNIRLGRPEASNEEVIEAARRAQAHAFIEELEQGYATLVGEKGACLSGGERQRIAIARAIVKDAPILILDEATASVDPENELHIQQGLISLMRGKTLLVIAHRLSTIRLADQILVLKDGCIAERGRHDDLLSQKGLYHSLWNHQEGMKSWKIRGGAEPNLS